MHMSSTDKSSTLIRKLVLCFIISATRSNALDAFFILSPYVRRSCSKTPRRFIGEFHKDVSFYGMQKIFVEQIRVWTLTQFIKNSLFF